MKNINFNNYIFINLLINISILIFSTFIIQYNFKWLEFLFLLITLMPGIFMYLIIKTWTLYSVDILWLYLLLFVSYFTFFITIHKYLFKSFNVNTWYIITVIFSILNMILWFLSVFEMMQ